MCLSGLFWCPLHCYYDPGHSTQQSGGFWLWCWLFESSGSHLDSDHFVMTQCKILCDFNVALRNIYSLPECDFSLCSLHLRAERICCRKLCKQILLQLPALLKSFIWNCLTALCIFVWNRCYLERAVAVWPWSSWCLSVSVFSCGKKNVFYEAGAFLRVSLPFFAQDQEW